MRCSLAICLGLVPGSLLAQAEPSSQPARATIAITHVTVIDVEAGAELRDRAVLVRDRTIAAVDTMPRVRVPADATVVDATGRYLIPGLWDMHVHTFYPDDIDPNLPTFIANGVTGVRDMGNSVLTLARIHELRAEIESRKRVGPRFVAAGPLVDGRPATWPNSVIADSPEHGRALVDSLVAAGADFIKVYSRVQPAPYRAIAQESLRRGVPFAGHVPGGITAIEASNAGQRSMEHLYGIVEGCSSSEADVVAARAALLDARARGADTLAAARRVSVEYRRALQGFDATRCGALAASLARNHSWQVPTLISYERFDCSAPGDLARDVRVRYVSPRRQMAWPKIRAALAQSIAADAELARADSLICAGALDRLTGFLAKAGVPLLAGTDAGVPYVLYGFGLHEELSLLAQAGLGPAGALRAATLNPAMFLGATDSLGAVAAGKLADLVLLDADPLADITNTTKIRAVFANGRYFDRSALDSLLGAAARAANGSR